MDLEVFAREISMSSKAIRIELEVGFKSVVEDIEKTAKEELGVYQPAFGPFDAWDTLADSTMASRSSAGYSENEPLLRSGELRDSIQSEVVGLAAIVGTKSDIGLYQEVGTSNIPPRPFIGPAYVRKIDKLMDTVGSCMMKGFKAY